MAEQITFELVSPEKLLMSANVDMVVVPGEEGYFGVLKNHAPMITTLQPGVIAVHEDGAVTRRLFVSGGFAEVDGETCTVLAQDAKPFDALLDEREGIELQIRNLQEDIADAKDAIEKAHLMDLLSLARAKKSLIDTYPRS